MALSGPKRQKGSAGRRSFSRSRMAKYRLQVDEINSLAYRLESLTDSNLKKTGLNLRKRVRLSYLRWSVLGDSSNRKKLPHQSSPVARSMLNLAFSLAREASRRVLGMRHYDVQVMGGLVLSEGNIAEVRTGEGKTLMAILPVYLRALDGEGVHVVTVNDYLAERDFNTTKRIYRFLGLSVGLVIDPTGQTGRKRAYSCNVTYLSANQLGFDYLRDNMACKDEDIVQRGFHYCVLDEVDSILVDELLSPLIISSPPSEVSERRLRDFQASRDVVSALKEGFHYFLDERSREVTFSSEGFRFCQVALGLDDLFSDRRSWLPLLLSALTAKEIYKLNRDYVVEGGEICIVDEFTGRVLEGRRWSEGLHQALEIKEGLPPTSEGGTLASISYGSLFSLYWCLSGMTGTIGSEADEINVLYGMSTVKVPPNRKSRRSDFPDTIFRSQRDKWRAVAEECCEVHFAKGRPLLIGTATVEKSELLSSILSGFLVPHRLLNARKSVSMEPEIISAAGCPAAVTIATNVAGRGTDICLGGDLDLHFHREVGSFWGNRSACKPADLALIGLRSRRLRIRKECWGPLGVTSIYAVSAKGGHNAKGWLVDFVRREVEAWSSLGQEERSFLLRVMESGIVFSQSSFLEVVGPQLNDYEPVPLRDLGCVQRAILRAASRVNSFASAWVARLAVGIEKFLDSEYIPGGDGGRLIEVLLESESSSEDDGGRVKVVANSIFLQCLLFLERSLQDPCTTNPQSLDGLAFSEGEAIGVRRTSWRSKRYGEVGPVNEHYVRKRFFHSRKKREGQRLWGDRHGEPNEGPSVGAWSTLHRAILGKAREKLKRQKEEVGKLGGLYVIGTERHSSKRIDDQLRGRSGRQGEPGSSRFFVCLEDRILRAFGGKEREGKTPNFSEESLYRPVARGPFLELRTKLSDSLSSLPEDSRFEVAQAKAEAFFYSERKRFYEWNQVLDAQRRCVYEERKIILERQRGDGWIRGYTRGGADDISAYLERAKKREKASEYVVVGRSSLSPVWPVSSKVELFDDACSFSRQLWSVAYDLKSTEIGSLDRELLGRVETSFALGKIDNLWSVHLQRLGFFRDFSRLQSCVWRDPLVIYREKTSDALTAEIRRVKHMMVAYLSRLGGFLF
jgi:preprotein translocase subunit SecA